MLKIRINQRRFRRIFQHFNNMEKIKILVVEDQKIIARDLASLLTSWDYQVVGVCGTGEEALKIFKSEELDMALVDIQLLGFMDGITLVEHFNAIRQIPIVYLTAQADLQTVERAKASSPAAYLVKPFDERTLQISLELAFDTFEKHQIQQIQAAEPIKKMANEVKLSAETILAYDGSIFIKQNFRFVKLSTHDLVYIEASRTYSYLHTTQQRHVVRQPLVAILEKLQIKEIIRVHRSYAINMRHVLEFNDDEITISNGKVIPFTPAYRDDFFKNFSVL